jgi:large subunit ribosomal protein L21
MKKAVIQTGGKQYLVSEGDTLNVELLKADKSKLAFDALLIIDGENVSVGTPSVDKVKVSADVIAEDVQADKVTAIRYKAKKRVHKVRGHRQHQTTLKITKIA